MITKNLFIYFLRQLALVKLIQNLHHIKHSIHLFLSFDNIYYEQRICYIHIFTKSVIKALVDTFKLLHAEQNSNFYSFFFVLKSTEIILRIISNGVHGDGCDCYWNFVIPIFPWKTNSFNVTVNHKDMIIICLIEICGSVRIYKTKKVEKYICMKMCIRDICIGMHSSFR